MYCGKQRDLKGIANLSDALSINGSLSAGIANIFFVSDGADQATLANFPVFARTFTIGEDGTLQNIGSDFGLAAAPVQVGSDVAGPEVPEPTTGLLFVIGLLTVGSLSLGGHLDPAIEGHFKTGQRRTPIPDRHAHRVDQPGRPWTRTANRKKN